MQNQKKPIQQKKPMQNFTAEKWADKIALFIDNFGFLSGFFWHWTIALPSPTSHLAMLHSKIILSDPNRRVKVVLIGFSLFWSRCRTWGTMGGLTDWPTARLGSGNSCVSESGVWVHFALRSTPKTDIEPEILSVNYVLGLLWDPRRRYQPVFQCRICFGSIVRWKQKISTWFLFLRSLTLAGDGATLVDKTHHLFFFGFSLLWALQRIMQYEGHWRPVASHMNIIIP